MIDTTSSRQDKFGFYQTSNFKTYSRLEAIEKSVQSGHNVHWNFNDEIYSGLDWTQEPKESLGELYQQRAQQLRDKYDYLVLWFSGGADSTNILNSFINNDIKLDEVASYVNYEATKDSYSWLNAEIYHVAGPVIDKAKIKQPELQHRIIDIAQLQIDFFSKKSTKFDWIYHVNYHVSPNASSRGEIALQIPQWKKLFDQGKKIGFIWGVEKPHLVITGKKYFFCFEELVDGSVSAECQMSNRSWQFNELFYWTPDLAKIPLKQAHTIKKYLKLATDPSIYTDIHDKQACAVQMLANKERKFLKSCVLHRLIYPGWTPVLYQVKASSLWFTPRDSWFFNLPDSDPAKYAWQAGLRHRTQYINDIATRHPDIYKRLRNTVKQKASVPHLHYYLGE
jgi:hypothetical protein